MAADLRGANGRCVVVDDSNSREEAPRRAKRDVILSRYPPAISVTSIAKEELPLIVSTADKKSFKKIVAGQARLAYL